MFDGSCDELIEALLSGGCGIDCIFVNFHWLILLSPENILWTGATKG